MKTNNPELYNSDVIDEILGEISPGDFAKNDKKMLLAIKIANAMKELNIKKSQLAVMMSKRPSEISKWLSGTHNFTVDTLLDLEQQLNIELVNVNAGHYPLTFKFHGQVKSQGSISYWGSAGWHHDKTKKEFSRSYQTRAVNRSQTPFKTSKKA